MSKVRRYVTIVVVVTGIAIAAWSAFASAQFATPTTTMSAAPTSERNQQHVRDYY